MTNYTVHQYFELSRRIKERTPITNARNAKTAERIQLEDIYQDSWRKLGVVSIDVVHRLAETISEERDLSVQEAYPAQEQGEIEEELFTTGEESEAYYRRGNQ